jgi:hypothetical protein
MGIRLGHIDQESQCVRMAPTGHFRSGPLPAGGRILVTGHQGNHAFSTGSQDRQVNESNREFFRLTYPRSGRPKFVVRGKSYDVAEVSEHGLRVTLPQAEREDWAVETTVCGRVQFSDDGAFDVLGEVVRHDDGSGDLQCVIRLSDGIPYARIVAEQRFMLQVFPASKKTK